MAIEDIDKIEQVCNCSRYLLQLVVVSGANVVTSRHTAYEFMPPPTYLPLICCTCDITSHASKVSQIQLAAI